ncbi:MAG TPA: iron-sulfur cluster carrier protein ApbC [Candidatus Thiothrix moscowensis]|uniref:iron-sulfur cluster carrier protein ApbC n=1 Tax=unclassified Thiothrix TaxID=2636184 RepID=UPI0025D35113|nr:MULTISPECIES: iron-sulfur cluster carrier protein ApbC [unclassified Thiothrix]HRJ52995.1 iron-sulfur cluster carrier protein ApbC [Candidatus Thiothrix moscowensis]HRJ92961.1 iron-sulfur cluster carrier protein ApbC [Candidatus Thiothrix moscowensis]
MTREQVEAVLKGIKDRYLDQDIISLHQVKDITADNGKVAVRVVLGYPAGSYRDELAATIRTALAEAGIADADVTVETQVAAHAVQKSVKRKDGIKNIIAVASGKGGVGKSTTAVNLALALQADGAKVGMLDADIYGPSQPRMLGISGQPESSDGKSLEPMQNHGIKAMSIGFLIEEDTPMIWRGPMVTQALEQLLGDTNWGDLDYLVIDLPPGTGDIQLTLSQKIPVSGAIIVTTPQDIALLDARKGLKMFEKVEVPILGIVENMSMHICSNCGTVEHIFGEGGGQRMAEQYGVNYLGGLPLDIKIREQVDNGNPSVVADPNGTVAQIYKDIARKAAARLAQKAKDYSTKFPTIKIMNV